MASFISWEDNRGNYSATRVRVTEVDKEDNYSRQFKIEGYVKHKWWYKSGWTRLDNNYSSSDTSLQWDEEHARMYAKLWLNYFKDPDKYDVDVPNVIFDEEVITRETHPEHFV